MKKIRLLQKLIVLLTLTLIIYSCNKKDSSGTHIKTEIEHIVNKWLKENHSSVNTIRGKRIENIKNNLDFTSASIEEVNKDEQCLIIPLKKDFVPRINVNEYPVINLLFVTDKQGNVRTVELVQFIPEDKNNRIIPKNTFASITNNKKIAIDGRFVFFSVYDKFLYELVYDDGVVAGLKNMKERESTSGASNITNQEICIDWYLISTYYYTDGTTETTEEFVGTTCYAESCQPNELCDELEAVGGGGTTQTSSTDVQLFENETEYTAADERENGGFEPIKYTWNATIARTDPGNQIISVQMHNTVAHPLVSWYTDKNRRTTRRSLVLLNHMNYFQILTPVSVLLTWTCYVHARYTYNDGTPELTRQWFKTKMKVG